MNIFKDLRSIFSKKTNAFNIGISKIFTKKKILDDKILSQLYNLLIVSDVGSLASRTIINKISKWKFEEHVSLEEIKKVLADIIISMMQFDFKTFDLDTNRVNLILMFGVNGSGKTTSIRKLSHYFLSKNSNIAIAACDTFRAAAVEQIKYPSSSQVYIYDSSSSGHKDPASIAYFAIDDSIKKNRNLLFIDTAGRLQNNVNLMHQLTKISKMSLKFKNRVCVRNILVLDSTIGQNSLIQVKEFQKYVPIDGLIITKMDALAKAGVLINIINQYKIPVYFVAFGEKDQDFRFFDIKDFVSNLVG